MINASGLSVQHFIHTQTLNRQCGKAQFINRHIILLFCSLFSLFCSQMLICPFLPPHSTTHGFGLLLPPTPDIHSPAINRKWCLKVSITDIGALSPLSTSLPPSPFSLFSIFFSCKPSLTLSTCGLWIDS